MSTPYSVPNAVTFPTTIKLPELSNCIMFVPLYRNKSEVPDWSTVQLVPKTGEFSVGLFSVGLFSVGLVSVLFVSVCVPDNVATVESIATVTAAEPL